MVAVGLWGAFLGPPAIWLLPVTFPLVMALGGALGVAGVPVPGIETGIAASALVIGAAVLSPAPAARRSPRSIVGVFAIFHGHAHGTEMPQAASPLAYAAGFVIATGLLHLAGIAIGLLTRSPPGAVAVRGLGAVIALAGARLPDRHAVRRLALAAALAARFPPPAAAHDAFGDLGPFYASCLHPLADPAQGLLDRRRRRPPRPPAARHRPPRLRRARALLARSPSRLHARRRAAAARAARHRPRSVGRSRPRSRSPACASRRARHRALAAAAAIAAGLAIDLPARRSAPGLLAALGGAAGIALLALLVWGAVDLAIRRLGPVAGAVAGAWIAAIGLMSAVLPA